MLSLKFNALIPGNENLALSSDLDPDLNFDMFRCDYFTESQFNELFHKMHFSFCNCFSLLHLNIRSLSRNYDNFTSFLANIEGKFPIMGVSETWLKDSEYSFDIMGYDFIHNPRLSTGGPVVEHRAVTREVVSSTPTDQHSGS